MPTYGYQCTECKHEFSVFQAMKDDPIEICPQCGSKVKRLLYPVGVVFKGSGWYINDSRKPDTSDSAVAEKAAADKSGSDTKGASESKGDSDAKSGGETKKDTTDSKPAEKTAAPAPASTPAAGTSGNK